MNWLIVTPSVRLFRPEFFEPLKEIDWMIVDDTDGRVDFAALLQERTPKPIVATRKMMVDELGSAASLIPQHNPSCKNFGLYWAWKKGYDGVILLDDDCDLRHTPDYLARIPVGQEVEAWTYYTPSGWYNTMTQLLTQQPGFFARGYPYEHRTEQLAFITKFKVKPLFNEGLWVGTPDINGVDKLQMMEEPGYNGLQTPPWAVSLEQHEAVPDRVLIGKGQSLPLSIMNVQLSGQLLPAFYQPPDWNVYGGYKIRRHDDVYSMLFLKKLMDRKADVATVGDPLIHHTKEGNVYREVLSEHNTHLLQPYLEKLTTEAVTLTPSCGSESYGDLAECAGQLMIALLTADRVLVPGNFKPILLDYAQRIVDWSRLTQYGPRALTRRVIPVSQKLL